MKLFEFKSKQQLQHKPEILWLRSWNYSLGSSSSNLITFSFSGGLQRSRPTVCIFPYHQQFEHSRFFTSFLKKQNPLFYTRVFSLLSAQWASRQMFAFHQGSSLMNAMPSDLLSRCSRNLHFALFQTMMQNYRLFYLNHSVIIWEWTIFGPENWYSWQSFWISGFRIFSFSFKLILNFRT